MLTQDERNDLYYPRAKIGKLLVSFVETVLKWFRRPINAEIQKNDEVPEIVTDSGVQQNYHMTDREICHMIATEMLGWAYARTSDTYWLEMGVEIGTAASFNPLTNEFQGDKVISTLELPCARENLKEYVLSLTEEQKRELRTKYGPIQRAENGIKYHVFRNGQWEQTDA